MPDARHFFPGIFPFIDRAADDLRLNDLRMRAKAKGMEHAARIQAALGQACHARPGDAAGIYEEAVRWRHSLAAALAGVDAALLDVAAGLGLDPPAGASGNGRADSKAKAHGKRG